jgi:hypothetical protein
MLAGAEGRVHVEPEVWEVVAQLAKRKQAQRPVFRRIFRIDDHDDHHWMSAFGLTGGQLKELVRQLQLPDEIRTKRTYFTGDEALCLSWTRLKSAGSLSLVGSLYKRKLSSVSIIYRWTINFISERWGHLLKFRSKYYPNDLLQEFSRAISAAGCPVPDSVAFIDGTFLQICQPSVTDQKAYYSGYHKCHGVNSVAIVTPDGLIRSIFGPTPGSFHDSRLLIDEGAYDEMDVVFRQPGDARDENGNRKYFRVLGDAGFRQTRVVATPFKNYGNDDGKVHQCTSVSTDYSEVCSQGSLQS